MPASKIGDYIEQRCAGLEPISAAMAAGYAQSGITVVTARLEQREDVRQALRAAKRVGKQLAQVVTKGSRTRRSVPPRDEEGQDDTPDTKEKWALKDKYDSPLDLLRDVMNNPKAPGGLRIQCAKDALPYCHARKETSKKEDGQERAKKTGAMSKFGAMPTPLRRAA